jgi:hypothetical protein
MTKTQIKQEKYNKRMTAKTVMASKTIGTTPPIFTNNQKAYVVGKTFMLETEYDKMHNLSYNEPAPYPTRLNDADVKNLPYNDSDAGFFIAALHRINNGLFVKQGCSPTEAQRILSKYKCVVVQDDIVRLSTYCTWDRAQQHYNEIANAFGYAFVGFSTPTQLMLLAEDTKKENIEVCV